MRSAIVLITQFRELKFRSEERPMARKSDEQQIMKVLIELAEEETGSQRAW